MIGDLSLQTQSQQFTMIWPFRRSAALPFRRNANDTLMWFMNLTVAVGIGVVSGNYMFKEPLEQYWTEKRRQEANAIAALNDQPQPHPPTVTRSTAKDASVSSNAK